jgi:hypothetical protein
MSLICIKSSGASLKRVFGRDNTAIPIEIALPALNASQRDSEHITNVICDVSIVSEPQDTLFYVLADVPEDHTTNEMSENS